MLPETAESRGEKKQRSGSMRLRLFAVLGLSAMGLFAATSPAQAAVNFVNPAVSSFADINTG